MSWNARTVASTIALSVALCGPLQPVLAAAEPQQLAERLAEGQRLFDLGRFEEALAAFQAADRLAKGGSVLSLLHLSRTYRQLKNYDLAGESARRALSLAADPDMQVAAYLALGLGLFDKPGSGAHLEEAEEAIRRAVELSGKRHSRLQPTLRMVIERREQALAAAAPPIFEGDANFERQLARARRLSEKGQFQEAAEAYQEADRLAGGASINTLNELAYVYRKLGEYDLAIDCIRGKIALQKSVDGRVFGYQELARELLAKLGPGDHLEEAERLFRRVLELNGFRDDSARAGLLKALERQGREAEALEIKAEIAAETAAKEAERAAIEAEKTARAAEVQAAAEAARKECLKRECTCSQDSERVRDELEAPKVRAKPTPRYTRRARAAKVRGVVILDMVIDERGKVCCPRVTKGLPMGLDKAALEAVKRWKFEPATRDGKPVCVYYVTTVSFDLQ